MRVKAILFSVFALCLTVAAPAAAQQTGGVTGKVVDSGGAVLPGVTVEARSEVLPGPRETVTDGNGEYRLPALPPGTYTLKFELSGMQVVTREAFVQLSQDTPVDATLGIAGVSENVTVTASASLIERDTASIKSGLSNQQIMSLPVGQEYRDLLRLIPGVQVTQDLVRGPSAGGSGQDNVYQFDGVNVTLPLFGTLSAEPASHDVAQVTTTKGGARAVDFDRSGGFTIDSVSKSGTSKLSGQLSYQVQTADMSAPLTTGSQSRYEQDRGWLVANAGGRIVPERLYFYGSYYRPDSTRDNRANNYGELPKYESTRNEGFGKLTFTPTHNVLINGSYRDSKREDTSDLFEANAGPTSGSGTDVRQKIATLEGSWIVGPRSHATFKFTRFANESIGQPDRIATVVINTTPGTRLDIASLDTLGRLTVPSLVAGQTAFNTFVQPIIDRYGFITNGARVGGGIAGFASQFNEQSFYRTGGQAAWNMVLGSAVTHELHAGYQMYFDSEDLVRRSNGWGQISVPGGRLAPIAGTGQAAYYTARFQQQTTGAAAPIKSRYGSHSLEINDAIRWKAWTFNVGLLASRDTLYGQGLREDGSAPSGYVAAPGNEYNMYEVPFHRMLQPRVGATWAYNGKDTMFASYAKYNPAASSLPRAASWDRNLIGTFIDAHFDANGVLFASVPAGSSTGKLFADDLTPRGVNEFVLGTARQLSPRWTARLYGRYREAGHFWEDTNNNARVAFNPPPGIPRDLYIPDLAAKLAPLGVTATGATFVIAELDDAYTKYYEATLESEWRGGQSFVRGSYTFSRYRGNFDQDNSSTANDDNIFIGSSNIADDAGRQLWDRKDGILRGDRPHQLKLYGYRALPWNASAGAFAVAQSGQPWEAWSYEPYIALTTSTSDTDRYAESAGARRGPAHWQLDLNYTQNVRLAPRLNLQLAGDLFNVFDRQTGYDFQPSVHNSQFGQPRAYYSPRRFQLAARLQF